MGKYGSSYTFPAKLWPRAESQRVDFKKDQSLAEVSARLSFIHGKTFHFPDHVPQRECLYGCTSRKGPTQQPHRVLEETLPQTFRKVRKKAVSTFYLKNQFSQQSKQCKRPCSVHSGPDTQKKVDLEIAHPSTAMLQVLHSITQGTRAFSMPRNEQQC